TWAGATENLRHDWSPLFVRAGRDIPEGNRQLIALGALPLAEDDLASAPAADLLVSLLERAELESVAREGLPAQQLLLDDGERGSDSPPSAARGVKPVSDEDPSTALPGPGQLGLIDGLQN
ncbi:MAG: hypothetical protein ACRDJC_19410, partial [Thermomicrobiales bacterium]